MVIHGLEMNMAGKFHGTIWTTVGSSHVAFVTFVMVALVVVVLVTSELVKAFHADALHLVSGTLSGCFGFVDASHELSEDAAEDAFTFGVWGVGGGRDGGDRMECELGVVRLDFPRS